MPILRIAKPYKCNFRNFHLSDKYVETLVIDTGYPVMSCIKEALHGKLAQSRDGGWLSCNREEKIRQPALPLHLPPPLFANENVIEMKDEVCFAYTGPGFKQGVTRI
jgi:hypothetical protein